MPNTTLLLLVTAVVGLSVVQGLPVDKQSMARTALLSLKTIGERVLHMDELPEDMRQALKEHRGALRMREAVGEAPGGGEAWSGDGGITGGAAFSPALLAFLSSSGVSEKDVPSVSRHLQHLEEER